MKTWRTGSGGVGVSVRDTGIGLPEAQLEGIFDHFVTSKPHGLGMGLAICRMLVRSHGGRLWAERRPGRGAAFYVALPLA